MKKRPHRWQIIQTTILRSLMKYSASKAQINALDLKVERAIEHGDFSTMLRGQSLLMIFHLGLSIKDAAQHVKRSEECVRLWLVAFLADGISSLKIKLPRGRQPKISQSQCRELRELLSNSPGNVGYEGGCWNAAMICDLIKKLFKVKYSGLIPSPAFKENWLFVPESKVHRGKSQSDQATGMDE